MRASWPCPTSCARRGRPAVAGRLLQREVEVLGRLLTDPDRPYVAVLGGAKVSDKLGVLDALVERVDALLIGGAMAFTLIAAAGGEVGESLVEPDRFDEVRAVTERARVKGTLVELPQDVVAAEEVRADVRPRTVPAREIPRGLKGSGHRPPHGRGVRADPRGRQDDPVERPDGRLRARAVLRRYTRGGHGDRRVPRRSPSSGVATRSSPSSAPGSRTRSTISPPAAGPRSSSSRASRCRASRSWRTDVAERMPIIAANWKMHKTHLEAIQTVQKLSYLLDRKDADRVEVVICPPFTALRSVQTLIDSDRLPYGLGAQDVHAEDEGAFTGEVSGPDAGGARRRLRDRGSLRTPPALRRGRRDGQPEGEGRLPPRHGPDRLRGGDPRGAGVGRDREQGRGAGPAGVRRRGRGRPPLERSSPTSRSGRSARAAPRSRPTPGRSWR